MPMMLVVVKKKLLQEKYDKMDDNRKKLKQTLEQKEKQAQTTASTPQTTANEKFKKIEIERLRREGNRLVIEELEKINLLVNDKSSSSSTKYQDYYETNGSKITIKFTKDLAKNYIYTEQELKSLFSKYGIVKHIYVTNKSAIIEFENDHISNIIENERGYNDDQHTPFGSVKILKIEQEPTKPKPSPAPSQKSTESKQTFEDYEAYMMKRLANVQTVT